MKHQIKTLTFDNQSFLFRDDGWFNATIASEKYGKRPAKWMELDSTKEYIEAMSRALQCPKNGLWSSSRGGRPGQAGTWLHPKLAVAFARWLDVDFAVWCDLQIDNLIRSYADWSKVRYSASLSTVTMGHVLQGSRAAKGKETRPWHYANEAKLVNTAFNGKAEPIDRDLLTDDEIQFLLDITQQNIRLLSMGLEYNQRKPLLLDFAERKRPQAPAVEFGDEDDDELMAA